MLHITRLRFQTAHLAYRVGTDEIRTVGTICTRLSRVLMRVLVLGTRLATSSVTEGVVARKAETAIYTVHQKIPLLQNTLLNS